MSSYTAQDLEALRRQAQEVEKVLNAQQAAQEELYRQQQAALAANREEALRQAYISQQQALTQLPEYLAGQGINGGPAESSLVQLQRAYGNQRGDIQAQYNSDLGSLQAQQAAAQADLAARNAQNRIDYEGAYSAIQAQQEAQRQQEELQRQQLEMQQQQAAQQTAQQAQWQREQNALLKQLQQQIKQATSGSSGRSGGGSTRKSADGGVQAPGQPKAPNGPDTTSGTTPKRTGGGRHLPSNQVALIR